MQKILILLLILIILPFTMVQAGDLEQELAGFILLQVESRGEAWYVDPVDHFRYYLGRPIDAFQVMSQQGVGISNQDLAKISIGVLPGSDDEDSDGLADDLEKTIGTHYKVQDTDSDGYSDYEEILNNYNPLGSGVLNIDLKFTNKNKGKIFLQVEAEGQAWYVNPQDLKRYYLGRPADAFNIMRNFGLGITNNDLVKIDAKQIFVVDDIEETLPDKRHLVETLPANEYFDFGKIEQAIHEQINNARNNAGLSTLEWNSEVASVAREHSINLARENEAITGFGISCDYPLIHHEGLDFGLYNTDRLSSRGVNYYNKAGENTALVSGAAITVRVEEGSSVNSEIEQCQIQREDWGTSFKQALDLAVDTEKLTIVNNELSKRKAAFEKVSEVEIAEIIWENDDTMATDIVVSWLDSPGHKENLMTADYDQAGVGVAQVSSYIIATQVFIKKADCGYLNGPCCQKQGYYPYCFLPLGCQENICK